MGHGWVKTWISKCKALEIRCPIQKVPHKLPRYQTLPKMVPFPLVILFAALLLESKLTMVIPLTITSRVSHLIQTSQPAITRPNAHAGHLVSRRFHVVSRWSLPKWALSGTSIGGTTNYTWNYVGLSIFRKFFRNMLVWLCFRYCALSLSLTPLQYLKYPLVN